MNAKQPTDPDDPYFYDPPSTEEIAGARKRQLERRRVGAQTCPTCHTKQRLLCSDAWHLGAVQDFRTTANLTVNPMINDERKP